MTKICNFPISDNRRCTQPITDDKPNCGRHRIDLSADQLGQSPTVYEKDDELHVWAGEPNDIYCLIHNDPAYQTLCQLAGEKPPCCLNKEVKWEDKRGKQHRENGPALISIDGTREWYRHGKLDREDGPAVVMLDGTQGWYQRGYLHRGGGPAVVGSDGTQVWYQHGKLHRDNGPASIRADGTQIWYRHNERHRGDGPAVIGENGEQEWWWRGYKVTEEQFAELQKQPKKKGVLARNGNRQLPSFSMGRFLKDI